MPRQYAVGNFPFVGYLNETNLRSYATAVGGPGYLNGTSTSSSTSAIVGAIDIHHRKGDRRRRHHPEDLERMLKRQHDAVFGRKWFTEFESALNELEVKAQEAETAPQEQALEKAVKVGRKVAQHFEATPYIPPNIWGIMKAFSVAAHAERVATAAQKARVVIEKVEDNRSAIEKAYDAVSDADEYRIIAPIKEKYGRN